MTDGQASPRPQPGTRSFWADKLKVALTMLVIAHHAAQPYGPTGGAWPVENARHSPLLLPFFAVNAAFFMGLFFLISGLFIPRSHDGKGAAGFLKSRLTRLGIPVAFFALFILGPISYLALAHPDSIFALFTVAPAKAGGGENASVFATLVSYLYARAWAPLFGHLWFLLHLLLYGLVYVLWRQVRRPAPAAPAVLGRAGGGLGHGRIVIYLLALAGVTWLVRIWYPVDRWVALFFIIPAEIAHLPQYFSLFMIGALAARRGWPQTTPARLGYFWLAVGLVAGGMFYLCSLAGLPLLPGVIAKGGPSWQSLLWCFWEATICTGLGVGLPVWFRERFNRPPGGLMRGLTSAAYGAYIVHVLIVVAIQNILRTAPWPPLAKFGLVTLAGIVLAFALSSALRRIPGVTKVL